MRNEREREKETAGLAGCPGQRRKSKENEKKENKWQEKTAGLAGRLAEEENQKKNERKIVVMVILCIPTVDTLSKVRSGRMVEELLELPMWDIHKGPGLGSGKGQSRVRMWGRGRESALRPEPGPTPGSGSWREV